MSKRVLAWSVVAAMMVGGTGYALGARAASREPEACAPAPVAAPIEPAAVPAPTTTPRETPRVAAAEPTPSVSHEITPRPRHDDGTLAVRRMTLTHGIEDHEPIDDASIFEESDERVVAFVEVENPTDTPRTLELTFEQGERSTGHVSLTVPAHMPRYRTWGWTRGAHHSGEWTAVVRDEGGHTLSRESFEIR